VVDETGSSLQDDISSATASARRKERADFM